MYFLKYIYVITITNFTQDFVIQFHKSLLIRVCLSFECLYVRNIINELLAAQAWSTIFPTMDSYLAYGMEMNLYSPAVTGPPYH